MKSIHPHLSAALACAITLTCASPAWAYMVRIAVDGAPPRTLKLTVVR